MPFYIKPDGGFASGDSVVGDPSWDEVDQATYDAHVQAYYDASDAATEAFNAQVQSQKHDDAQTVYDGAVSAGFPHPAALVMAHQIDPGFTPED